MAEAQLSMEGCSYNVERPCVVPGTQNPVEPHGCYSLPEAHFECFLMKLSIGFPDPEQEERIHEDQQDRVPALAHRLILRHQALLEGRTATMAVRSIVEPEAVEEP